MSGGLRILCLDGGGTRGLSTIYMLREIMDRIVPGRGGSIRPTDYFDMIGASGPNGLIALMFTKFGFTIDEALEFFHDFARRLDNVETVLANREGEELDGDDWESMIGEYPDFPVTLETVRRQVVCNTFRDVVLQRVTDWLAKSENKEGNEFSYKMPCAVVGVGRCRAAIMGSEVPGHGPNKGVVKHRTYHVPLWHKSYVGRHTRPTYTWWAIGLGTMGSPSIVSNGVIFGDFWATGAHSDHNPVQLLLQECNRIWPGLKAKLVISLGTGHLKLPENWNKSEHPHSEVAAQACLEICNENQKKARDLEKFVLPHDEVLQSAYFRFDVPTDLPFFEFEARDTILTQTVEYLTTPSVATSAARAIAILEEETFPNTAEDQLAFSSLASLLMTFMSSGYHEESTFISDAISSYALYESTKVDAGSHRKLVMAASASQLASYVFQQLEWGATNSSHRYSTTVFSLPFYLNSLMAYGRFEGSVGDLGQRQLPPPVNNAETSATAYYVLTCAKRQDHDELQSPLFNNALHQISFRLGLAPEVNSALIFEVETLLQISSLATLCEAAIQEALSDEPRLILNGKFLQHFTSIVLKNDLTEVDLEILDPIATFIATLLHIGGWSTYRDPLIIKLLTIGITKTTDSWFFANLAVERIQFSLKDTAPGSEDSECLNLCHHLAKQDTPAFKRSFERTEVNMITVQKGYIGLLRKVLEADDDLDSLPSSYTAIPRATASNVLNSTIDQNGNSMLHITAKNGFLLLHKMMMELLGMIEAKPPLAKLNNDGLAPIHLATKARGHKNVMLLCLYGGGDVNQLDAFGRNPLHYCFPEKKDLNEYLPALEEFVAKNNLCLTLPVNTATVWGGTYNQGKEIDNRHYTLRTIIRQLYCRGGSITTQDENGVTPPHLAAKNGWGLNSDLFFISITAQAEEESQAVLRLRDRSGNSVLALMRINGDAEGEKIISSEMRKRSIDTSEDKNPQNAMGTQHHNVYGNPAAGILPQPNSVQYHPSMRKPIPSAPVSPLASQNSPISPTFSQHTGHNSASQPIPYHTRQVSPVPPSPSQQTSHYRVPSNTSQHSQGQVQPKIPLSPAQQQQQQYQPYSPHTPQQSSQYSSETQYFQQQQQQASPPAASFGSHPSQQQYNQTPNNDPNIYRPPQNASSYQQQVQAPHNRPPMTSENSLGKKETLGKLFGKIKKRL